jgi:hypothetical protein
MLAKVRSCAVIGLGGALLEVEVDLSNGLAGFMIVGLPDTVMRFGSFLTWDFSSRENHPALLLQMKCTEILCWKRVAKEFPPAL